MIELPPANEVDITHESRVSKLGAGAWLLAIPLLALGALARLDVPAHLDDAALFAIVCAFMATPLFMLFTLATTPIATYLARARHRGAQLLRGDDDGIRVVFENETHWFVPWSEVGVAWAREQRVVELATAGGDEARMSFASTEAAMRFVALVRQRADTRRAYPLALEGDVWRVLRKVTSWLVPSAIAATCLAIGPWGWGAVPVALSLSWLGAKGSPRIMLGADGVLVQGRLTKRYVPYRDIAAVVSGGSIFGARTLWLQLVNGKRVRVAWMLGPQRMALARALIEEGMRMAERGAEAGAEYATLARAEEEDESTWRDRVHAATRNGGYRGPALDAETLLALMRNPAADPDQRVAAALAMRTSSEGVARIRIAASVSTEPEVKEALDALAVEGDLDEGRVTRALRKLSTKR